MFSYLVSVWVLAVLTFSAVISNMVIAMFYRYRVHKKNPLSDNMLRIHNRFGWWGISACILMILSTLGIPFFIPDETLKGVLPGLLMGVIGATTCSENIYLWDEKKRKVLSRLSSWIFNLYFVYLFYLVITHFYPVQ